MQYLETKGEVKEIQSNWEEELYRLGEDLEKKKKENPFDIIFWLFYVDLKISIISISIEAIFLLIAEHYIKNLEVASSSYQKVLEENRVLYNQVQDLKGFSPLSCIF